MTPERRLLEKHPHWPQALAICEKLKGAGFRALLAGGCVRDALLGVIAQDLDIATSARPTDISGLFEKTVNVGESFGVMRVLLDGADLEVATFRSDGEYKDGRHPENVHFSDEKEDALRRDFTVNALFFDPFSDLIVDHVNGRSDLNARVLRTVGEPDRRFAEDHLRLLRAVRFAAQLDFEIELGTWNEIRRLAPKAATVSRERIRDELGKLLKRSVGERGTRLLEESGLLSILLPSLSSHGATLRTSAELFLKSVKASLIEEAFSAWLASVAEAGDEKAATEAVSSLRFSRNEERFIGTVLSLYPRREDFWHRSAGRQLLEYDQPAVRWTCSLWDVRWGHDVRHVALQARWRALGGDAGLPTRILRGDDLPQTIQGSKIGDILREAYEAQLEGAFAERGSALTWLRERLKVEK